MRKKKGHNKLKESFDFDKDETSDKLPPWVPFEIEENKPIVNCKFCGSVHTLSTQQINSTY